MLAASERQSPGWDVHATFAKKKKWVHPAIFRRFQKKKKEKKRVHLATELWVASRSPGSSRVKRLAESKQNSEISLLNKACEPGPEVGRSLPFMNQSPRYARIPEKQAWNNTAGFWVQYTDYEEATVSRV